MAKAKYVYDRNGKDRGTLTGGERQCQLEGCCGTRLGVRWKDGKRTFPCTKGLKTREDGEWQIA